MKSNAFRTILSAGLFAGVLDITAAIVISLLRGRTAVGLLQSVASGLLGMEAYEGGLSTAILGGLLHFTIALSAAAFYYAASRRLSALWKLPFVFGPLYGVAVYFFMNLIVLPLSAFPHQVKFRFFAGLIVHIACVGFPIAFMVSLQSQIKRSTPKQRKISISNAFCLLIITSMFLWLTSFGFAQTGSGRATFAGGCYWCMEEAFEGVEGIVSVTSGFEGNVEAVDVRYDSGRISYEKLLEVFWKNVDPTDSGGQFCDRGPKYRSAIFYHNEAQQAAAERTKREIQQILNQPVVTQVTESDLFSVAPEEDQDYYKKEPVRYKEYKTKCGRARRLNELWQRP